VICANGSDHSSSRPKRPVFYDSLFSFGVTLQDLRNHTTSPDVPPEKPQDAPIAATVGCNSGAEKLDEDERLLGYERCQCISIWTSLEVRNPVKKLGFSEARRQRAAFVQRKCGPQCWRFRPADNQNLSNAQNGSCNSDIRVIPLGQVSSQASIM
jgi:hypothetical protein